MHDIHNPGQYPPDVLTELKQMSPLTIDIANRWSCDWPTESDALIAAGQFLDAVQNQERDERWAINKAKTTNRTAEAVAARHFLFPNPPAVTKMNTSIPESGPWEGPPNCVMHVSEPFEVDGKLIRAIKSRHSDGFVCLQFDDVVPLKESEREDAETNPQTSIWSRLTF